MSDGNVIPFPISGGPTSKAEAFRDWLGWAECELAILGYDMSATRYDWEAAYRKGLRPEVAAARAAGIPDAG